MLEWAKQNFDYIILDLPHMSVAADAESMANLADASLLIVRQNVAFASELNNAIGNLEQHRAKMLGCVLNNVYSTQLSSGQSYGYGGYSKYRHYGHYGNPGSGGSGK
jgi:Mrp family chromosome partitioning ATPase